MRFRVHRYTPTVTDPHEPLVSSTELGDLTRLVEADFDEYMGSLEHLVNIDCGSYTKSGVDQIGAWMQRALLEIGATVTTHPDAHFGDTVVGEWRGRGTMTALVIGHMDTVFDPGTVAQRPFRVEGDRAYGPGVTDMKGGLLAGVYALRALRALGDGGRDWPPFAGSSSSPTPTRRSGRPSVPRSSGRSRRDPTSRSCSNVLAKTATSSARARASSISSSG